MTEEPRQIESVVPCNICGGTFFVPGPGGRLSMTKTMPRCRQCGSLERHRLIRSVWEFFPRSWLGSRQLLQFSLDESISREWFRSAEVSIYKKRNSLDVQAIDRCDESYDVVVCNHVLEHVADDRTAFGELIRILRPEGILQLSVPSPATRDTTEEWGFPDSGQHGHFRLYGRGDIVPRFQAAAPGVAFLEVSAVDPVTRFKDWLYFASRSAVTLGRVQSWLRSPAIGEAQ